MICLALLAACEPAPATDPVERAAALDASVERVVRAFPAALGTYDFAAIDTLTAPAARWVDSRGLLSMDQVVEVLRMADSRGVAIAYGEPRDLAITAAGGAAWAAYLIDATLTAGSDEGLDLLRASLGSTEPGQEVWRKSFAESVVLRTVEDRWRIALGHTTELP